MDNPDSYEEFKKWFKGQIRKQDPGPTSQPAKRRSAIFDPTLPRLTLECDNSALRLTLKETCTIPLLTIVSAYTDPQLEKDEKLSTTNEITGFNGRRLQKSLEAETQTPKSSEKSKGSETAEVKVANSFVNASAWDLYDTYAQIGGDEGLGIKEFQLLIDTALKTRGVIQAQFGSGSEFTKLPADKQMGRIIKMKKFQYCVLTLERLLASQAYSHKQISFRSPTRTKGALIGSLQPSFNYQLTLLWTYDNYQHLPVTCLDWNPLNPMLLAAGYGRLNAEQPEEGYVCIWSPKNPIHPERKVLMLGSVTTLKFSKARPNILAAGCRSGLIYIIDVATTEPTTKLLSRGDLPPRFGAIWKIDFVDMDENGKERLLSMGDAGVLTSYSVYPPHSATELVELRYAILMQPINENGLENEIPSFSSKVLGGLNFSLIPQQHSCFISTKEGVLAKVRVRAPCCIESQLLGHMGAVLVIQHSPVCSQIFMTCGADGHIKVWVDGIDEALITLTSSCSGGQLCCEWSPTHPTLFASITNNEIQMWDISRCSCDPLSTIRMRSNDQCYTTLRFSEDGLCVVVGDMYGHVRVYQLTQLPRAPYLKVEALCAAIENILHHKPQLLHQFRKLIVCSKDNFSTKVIV